MPDQYGLDRQNDNGTYMEGSLEGQTSVTVLISAEATKWLEHAVTETGYSFDRLVQISAEEAALGHARTHKLF